MTWLGIGRDLLTVAMLRAVGLAYAIGDEVAAWRRTSVALHGGRRAQ